VTPGASEPRDRRSSVVEVVLLTAPDCHLCVHGRKVLDGLAEHLPLAVREVDLLSDEGRRLLAVSRVPFPPAALVGGRLLAHGRLSARSLTRQLAAVTRSSSSVGHVDAGSG
jgi:hypothetical protein